ncbi:MAG: carbohydrate-binding domain-containing protein [Clostridia bacterium]|nr:carbohydrate-binding domain-containing protein [Clostridia bacterium]
MKKRKTLTSILCAALLCSNIVFGTAMPASASETDVTTFTFTDSGITVSNIADTNYKTSGCELTITGAGNYKITGKCADGSIKVKKSTTGVTLTLEDLELSNSSTAPLVCNKNSQADIIVKGDVTLSDSVANSEDYWLDQGYTESDTEVDNAENAVIKLKGASKVTISGDGTLNINAAAKNGIKSGATLDSELSKELEYDPKSEYFAYLTMSDLTVNIDTTNVYTPKSSSTSTTTGNPWIPGGNMGQDVDYYGDGINAESCLNIRSGTYNINAGDDAIHSDYLLNIGSLGADNSELDINVNKSYEGIEGAVINFYSGDIDVIAGDDAINAANGDLSKYNFELNIYGGNIYADASSGNDNDGLDSNGSISVYGGKTVALADSGGNAFDLEGSFNVEGGSILGLGSYPMEGEKLNSATKQTWAAWSGSGAGGMGGRGGRGGMGGSNGTNISQTDRSKVTLTAGSTSYAIGDSIGSITSGTKVSVMLNGSQEIISTTAKTNVSYITFAGDINGTPDSTLTYNANNGTSNSTSATAQTGSAITVAGSSFTNDSKTFKEWNTQSDGMGVSYSAGDTFIIPCDSTLYAVWEDAASSDPTDTGDATTTGFKGTFVIEGGSATITTYATHDYTNGEENQTEAYAREDNAGGIVTDGTGQINFKVTPAAGYTVKSVSATEGTYKNIKTPEDTGAENTYRITKITGDLTITITLEKSGDVSENKILYGDATCDGTVDSADALMVLRYSVGLAEMEEGSDAYIASDVNSDGFIDSADALYILRYSVGISDSTSLAGKERT